jgi:hemerythrin
MALITWTQDLSVQVAQFDSQHKELVGLVNDLHDAMASGKGNTVLGKTLAKLIDYTKTHFAAEEKLMQQHSYPGYLSHKMEHDTLTKKALEIKSKFDSGSMIISVELMNFLKDWLTKHILGVDKKYGPFLNNKGIS